MMIMIIILMIIMMMMMVMADHVSFGTSMVVGGRSYERRSVVVHRGAAGGGHYWAFVRSCADEWFRCDDSEEPETVGLERVLAASGYVFLYEASAGGAASSAA